ncbi:hypothetical protein OIV83_006324 [Microbotryomycetes sp. JL201]|nr:hypothetical protein OIV83_006324 [Microbotryomycetes sp. JL201]
MFARRVVQISRPVARQFSAQAVVRKDFVQELYLKELKAYKPSTNAAAQAGAVKSYSTPSAPKAPEVPDSAALAKDLESYDAAAVPVDAPKASSAAAGEGEEAGDADAYLELCEADVKVEAKH